MVTYHIREKAEPFAGAKFHLGASLVRLNVPRDRDGRRGGGIRQAISGFTFKARKSMLLYLNTIAQDAELPLFVTLTYPTVFEKDPRIWKDHLNTWATWMADRFSAFSEVWKLEPQKRLAPHYHLMIYGVGFLPWQLVAVRWTEIVFGISLAGYGARLGWPKGEDGCRRFRALVDMVRGDGFEDMADHLQAGTETRKAKSRNGVKCYAGKAYMGKDVEGFEGVGRFWGVHGRSRMPVVKAERVSAPRSAVVTVARIARRFMRREKGYRAKQSGTMDIFTENPGTWARLLDEVIAGRVGSKGAVRTLADEDRIEKEGRRVCSVFGDMETACASRAEEAFDYW